jgi:hypothetical protein
MDMIAAASVATAAVKVLFGKSRFFFGSLCITNRLLVLVCAIRARVWPDHDLIADLFHEQVALLLQESDQCAGIARSKSAP